MKRLLTLVAFFATLYASAQQVNPVPDYVFANRMSAGRNTVTDTAAYFSIGPRYGATRGMMPPMVVDTASFSGNKRNGLLIFSIQKNKFLYWDSVGVKWAEMAGTGGSAITGSGVAGYMPEFTTTTNIDTTRLYHSGGRFAIGGTTVTNGLLNVYGDTYAQGTNTSASFIPTSSTVPTNGMYLQAANRLGFATNSTGRMYVTANGQVGIGVVPAAWLSTIPSVLDIGTYGSLWWASGYTGLSNNAYYGSGGWTYTASERASKLEQVIGEYRFNTAASGTAGNPITWIQAMTLNSNSELLINSTVDAGDYKLQVSGNIYSTGGAALAMSSGNVGIGTTSPNERVTIQSGAGVTAAISFRGNNLGQSEEFFLGQGSAGTYYIFGRGNYDMGFGTNNTTRMTIKADGELWVGYTADQGNYILQANGDALVNGNLRTAAPTGGTANDWRLGTVATVSPTSPNRTIEVSIGGTIYYIAAKTTND